MNVRDVITLMDQWAPPDLAYSWDRAGLATGDPDAEVSRVLVCLTVTRDAFKAARKAKADMIVAHHPLIWDPITTLRRDDARAALSLDIAEAGVACYSAHTNLDIVPGGVNHVLADRLNLTRLRPLFPPKHAGQIKLVTFIPETHLAEVRDAVCTAGAGVIGDYTHCSFSTPGIGTFRPGVGATPFSGSKFQVNQEPEMRFEVILPKARLGDVLAALNEAHPYEEVAYDLFPLLNTDPDISLGLRGELNKAVSLAALAEQVRSALDITHVRCSGDAKRKVKQIAVMGGAGGGSTPQVPGDVDVFVTGDVKYHEAVDAAERGLAVIDAGHHGTEKWIVPAIADYLKKAGGNLKVSRYMEPDPFVPFVAP